jgi:hypothetical protein
MHDEQYESVRKQVMVRLTLQGTFVINLIFGLLIVAALAQDISSGSGDAIGAAFFIFLWLTGLIIHGLLAFNLFNKIVDRTTHHALERADLADKPKRHRLELGEDGELVEVVDEWEDDKEKRGESH